MATTTVTIRGREAQAFLPVFDWVRRQECLCCFITIHVDVYGDDYG